MSYKEHKSETEKSDLSDPLLRENEEPRENSSPIPVFLLFVFAALCFWGGIYLVEHRGGFSKNAYTLDYDPDAKAAVVEIDLFKPMYPVSLELVKTEKKNNLDFAKMTRCRIS